jgi:hypothetical protein
MRSSRRLEREARRNLELIWRLRNLAPGYRTIANFRRDNPAALKAANREFVLLARSLDLLGGELVAINAAFFHGDASKASILTKNRRHEQMAALDRGVEEYSAALEANDKAEEAPSAAAARSSQKAAPGQDMAQKLGALRQRRAAAVADLAKLSSARRLLPDRPPASRAWKLPANAPEGAVRRTLPAIAAIGELSCPASFALPPDG